MLRSLGILIWSVTALISAEGSVDNPAAAGVAEFGAAYREWDSARFQAAADLFRQACTNAPGSPTNFYWLGAAEFHRALQLQTVPAAPTNALAVAAALDAAMEALLVAVKLAPEHAESHALLGTIYGMKIDGNLLRAVRFGPRVSRHGKLALQFGAENPRVRYLLGTCQFHTAKGAVAQREALATFLLTDKLYSAEAKQPAGPLDPRWGHSSCLTFIGRTYELLGQRAEAAAYFRRAILEHPADTVAKAGLQRVTNQQ
jgi:tetratricopeptide (TPR) repeat protein